MRFRTGQHKARQTHSQKRLSHRLLVRHPFDLRSVFQVDDQAQEGTRFNLHTTDALAPALPKTAQHVRGCRDDPPVSNREFHAVIGHMGRKAPFRSRLQDQKIAEPGLAGSRTAAEQDTGRADENAGGMNVGPASTHAFFSAGSETMKRAPRTRVSPVSGSGSSRFSTAMVPRWASMIWREMDRPRPELLPKPSASGRSV